MADPIVLPPSAGQTINPPMPYVGTEDAFANILVTNSASTQFNNNAQLGFIDRNATHRPLYGLPVVNNPIDANGMPDFTKGWNQMMVSRAQFFDPFIQRLVLEQPRWWYSRIPRGAFPMFNGAVHETRIFRGGLHIYSGLSNWSKINPVPIAGASGNNPSSLPTYRTFNYAVEGLAWRGMRAAWGSEPICVDQFKYIPEAVQQLKWILEIGAEHAIVMQEVFNRDFYIYTSVLNSRSFVMNSGSTMAEGFGNPRYFYDPMVKVQNDDGTATVAADAATGVAESAYVMDPTVGQSRPFVVIDATNEIEMLNFDTLDRVREQLSIRAPRAAVTNDGGVPVFTLLANGSDIDNSIRGDTAAYDEWRRGNPMALIKGYNITGKMYRRWAVVTDLNQLRFKPIRRIASYTAAEALHYGNVGYTVLKDKPVIIAVAVDPLIASPVRSGINGGDVPVDNPDYHLAPLAISVVFMNNIFSNLYESNVTSLGNGTYFGAMPGLNGTWQWLNIQTEKNPLQRVGNFYGGFAIHPKPGDFFFESISFIYRRFTDALRARTPLENKWTNPDYTGEEHAASVVAGTVPNTGDAALTSITSGTEMALTLATTPRLALNVGRPVTLKLKDNTTVEFVVLDPSAWPVVKGCPTAAVAISAATGITATHETGYDTLAFDSVSVVGR